MRVAAFRASGAAVPAADRRSASHGWLRPCRCPDRADNLSGAGTAPRPTRRAMSESTLADLGSRVPKKVEYGRDALIVCDNLVRIYQTGDIEVQALQGLDLLVDQREMVAL